jgi:hypothetical protein
VTHGELIPIDGGLFSPQHLAVYPVLGGIPCLREDNSIVASHFGKILNENP